MPTWTWTLLSEVMMLWMLMLVPRVLELVLMLVGLVLLLVLALAPMLALPKLLSALALLS